MSDITYSEKDVVQSYRWLGHQGWTELNAIDVERKQRTRIAYVRDERKVLDFVRRHHHEFMVCYGLNERPGLLKNEQGYARCAREQDIEVCSNLVIDIDFQSSKVSEHQRSALLAWIEKEASDYCQDLGFSKPGAYADTGQGAHLLFALPRMVVADHPDIAARLKCFTGHFSSDHKHDLADLEARVDSTQDLRRMLRVYGTAKPGVGIVSTFYGSERIEDEALRDYLLSMKLEHGPKACASSVTVYGASLISVRAEMEPIFQSLLQRDAKLRSLYEGTGKPANTDTSGSGYDYALVRRALALGYRDIDGLATVLALRPNGSYQNNNKDERYLRRTIAKALAG